MEEKKDSDTLDFSKIKDFFRKFKGREKESEKNANNGDEISINEIGEGLADGMKKIAVFAKKYSVILLMIIPIFLAFFIRIQALELHVMDNFAENSVQNFNKQILTESIKAKFPTLPAAGIEKEVNAEYEKRVKENKVLFPQGGQLAEVPLQTAVSAYSDALKSKLKNNNGDTYLSDIDTYYFARFARNLAENGHVWDTEKNGKPWNDHRIAPIGSEPEWNWHSYVNYLFFRISQIFGNKELMNAVAYVPVIIAALSVIPCFFLIRRVAGNFGATAGSTMLAVHNAFVTRTVAGSSDTDVYNVFFPLLISWLFIEAFEAKEIKKKIGFGIIGGILVGIYSRFWTGWWYVVDFIIATALIYAVYEIIRHYTAKYKNKQENTARIFEKIKDLSFSILPFFFSAMLSVAVLFTSTFKAGLIQFFDGFFAFPLSIITIKEVALGTIWPNVLTTVAELNPSSFSGTINITGGALLMALGFMGIILSIARRDEKGMLIIKENGTTIRMLLLGTLLTSTWFLAGWMKNYTSIELTFLLALLALCLISFIFFNMKAKEGNIDIKYAAFLALWFIGIIYGSTKGIRFTLLLVPAFSIAIGIFFEYLKNEIELLLSMLEIRKAIGKIISITALVIIFSVLVFAKIEKNGDLKYEGTGRLAYERSIQEAPMMNDGWWDSLTKIKENSQPNAIITSWWDYGHWFQFVADRPVTFDGASQNLPQAHFVGRMLQTNDEKEAIALLKMIDCGGHYGYYAVKNEIKDDYTAVQTLKTIIMLDRDEAKKYLEEKNISPNAIEGILNKTHCTPPEAFVIASDDMIGKAGVWGHFGSWNFKKAEMVRDVRGKSESEGVSILKEEFNLSESEAKSTYDDIKNKDPNQWITTSPGYFSKSNECTKDKNDTFKCPGALPGYNEKIAIYYNTTSNEAYVMSNDGKKTYVKRLLVMDKNGTIEKTHEESQFETGMVIIPEGEKYRTVLADPLLSSGIYTRMFFTEGHGLKCFDLFDHQVQLTGGDIFVYKVDWNCTDANNVFFKNNITDEAKTAK